MSTNKTTDNLVADIYSLMESKDADPSVDVEAEIERFGEGGRASERARRGAVEAQVLTLVVSLYLSVTIDQARHSALPAG